MFPDQDIETEGRQTAQERVILENMFPEQAIAYTGQISLGDPVAATDEDMNLDVFAGWA